MKRIPHIVFAIAVGFYLITAISIHQKEFVSNDKDRLLIE